MKVFIENEVGSDQKNIFDEKKLEYKKTFTVSRKYPFAYGFILGTTSGDGDNVDCFVLTEQKLKTGQIIECNVMGIMEQVEDGEMDHNILASMMGDSYTIDQKTKSVLTDFVSHVFDHLPGKKVHVGTFLGKEAAEDYIKECMDKEKVEGRVG